MTASPVSLARRLLVAAGAAVMILGLASCGGGEE